VSILRPRTCVCATGDKLEDACRDLLRERDEMRREMNVARAELDLLRSRKLCKGSECQIRKERDELLAVMSEQAIEDIEL